MRGTMKLSVLIPSRNEAYIKNTVDNLLENIRGDTQIIIICDGCWPVTPIPDHPKVVVIHFTEPVGQRAAVNYGAKLSRAEYIMKLDAHCAVDEGFDVKITSNIDYDWTVVPRLYNLHAFDWVCDKCGDTKYQGPTPKACEKCGIEYRKNMLWEPRFNRRSDFMRFDSEMLFQYWLRYERRPEGQGDICDVMGNLGACWVMHRKRYWELEGLDEAHGGWGQLGTEISCKTWLSGGRQIVNKTTWYSHMFRTQGGDFSWPYPITSGQVNKARKYSRALWRNDAWNKATKKLQWLVEKFAPVPGWEEVEFA